MSRQERIEKALRELVASLELHRAEVFRLDRGVYVAFREAVAALDEPVPLSLVQKAMGRMFRKGQEVPTIVEGSDWFSRETRVSYTVRYAGVDKVQTRRNALPAGYMEWWTRDEFLKKFRPL
jgi:hypothetical protein